ncbi:carbonic anhydrase [Apibacter muscae]|uniref:carbonic anhydrase family protein n=1 Tax=Apibacter muscae TaxID=2509004 RepID=UPI0011ACA175|nr:carbonic anhydrase family protein [Apibacter muscae]TWP22890.1 carbonic anhydrase [Apibacter muscae]
MRRLIISLGVIVLLVSCKNNLEDPLTIVTNEEIISNKIITKEDQEKLTPDQVIQDLKDGNKDFVDDKLTIRNNSERVREASLGQYPEAVVLSCLDSRVPVEDVFHKGIGDIFVTRVAGNIVNDDILGSLEYACKVSGSKVVLVLGHEHCGAIKSSIKGVELGHITHLLDKIKPAVLEAKETFKGEQSAKNPEFVDAVCKYNVELSLKEIRERSPILRDMEEKGEIKIIGGIYDMKEGKVEFL